MGWTDIYRHTSSEEYVATDQLTYTTIYTLLVHKAPGARDNSERETFKSALRPPARRRSSGPSASCSEAAEAPPRDRDVPSGMRVGADAVPDLDGGSGRLEQQSMPWGRLWVAMGRVAMGRMWVAMGRMCGQRRIVGGWTGRSRRVDDAEQIYYAATGAQTALEALHAVSTTPSVASARLRIYTPSARHRVRVVVSWFIPTVSS